MGRFHWESYTKFFSGSFALEINSQTPVEVDIELDRMYFESHFTHSLKSELAHATQFGSRSINMHRSHESPTRAYSEGHESTHRFESIYSSFPGSQEVQSTEVPEQFEHDPLHTNSTGGITHDSASTVFYESAADLDAIYILNLPEPFFENGPLFSLFFMPVRLTCKIDPSGISLAVESTLFLRADDG